MSALVASSFPPLSLTDPTLAHEFSPTPPLLPPPPHPPYSLVNYPLAQNNPQTLLVVTPYGGHIGWIAGKEAPFGRPWTDELVMEYLIAVEEKGEGGGEGRGKGGR